MWVVTVFEKEAVRIFEFDLKEEATKILLNYKGSAILSYTK